MGGFACDRCGWEWTGKRPPDEPGECGAHIGGRECPTPKAFAEYKRHVAAGCFADGRWHDTPSCPSVVA